MKASARREEAAITLKIVGGSTAERPAELAAKHSFDLAVETRSASDSLADMRRPGELFPRLRGRRRSR
jgi:hypothetical protein